MEAVVAVDDTAVEIVQVTGGKTTTIQLHHRAQIGRDNGQRGQHHPFRAVAALTEVLHHPQALGGLLAALFAAGRADLFAQFLGHLVQVDLGDNVTHRFGAHAGGKDIAPAVGQFTVAIFGEQLALFQRLQVIEIALHLVADLLLSTINFLAVLVDLRAQLAAGMVAEGGDFVTDIELLIIRFTLQGVELVLHGVVDQHVMVGRNHLALLDHNVIRPGEALVFGRPLADAVLEPSLQRLRFGNGLGSRLVDALVERCDFLLFLGVQLSQASLKLAFQRGDLAFIFAFDAAQAHGQFTLVALNGAAARVFVDVGNNKLGKIKHALQVARADIQE